MQSVPFSLEAYEGLANVEGILKFENDIIFIQYETKDGIFGVIKSGVKEIQLHVGELDDVDFSSNMFRTRLYIRPNDLGKISDIPGSKSGQLSLKIKRANKRAAKQISLDIGLAISRHHMMADNDDDF